MSDATITKAVTYDRAEMVERGRRGGLAKAARAKPAVTLTGAEAEALAECYRLLGNIARRAKPAEPPPEKGVTAEGESAASGEAA